jgi:N-methylhydantoinase B
MTIQPVTPATEQQVDPVTYEVIRHRLWSINDEQGLIAARISGSPAIYEAYDFNAAILDRDGACLFLGVYVTFLGTTLSQVVRTVLERFEGNIEDGDIFVTNDPWAGAMHMNDFLVVAPVFDGGELICWTGVAMHESDVGGPVPGSFVVGATDVYGESPLIPPLKLAEKGKLRGDIEALLLRNTRTAPLNALNFRARVAAQVITRKRILGVVERYGRETLLAVIVELKRQVAAAVRQRLASLPDGQWSERLYIDHDGNNDELYPVLLTMTKSGERLTFDFRGTAKQAPGMINCARSGLEGGVMSAVLPMLCYDIPWTPGALDDVIEIISEEGTVNNAQYPAAVSMATISAGWMTGNVCNSCIAKMFAASDEYRDEVQACWYPGWHGLVIAGLDQYGAPLAAILMDTAGGGGGARSIEDGIDVGGYLCAISTALPNVETNERLYPILELYRRQSPDTAGAGRFRGGVASELAFTPHKTQAPLQAIVFSTGGDYPAAPGIYGGGPSSVQRHVVLRGTDIAEKLAASDVPESLDELTETGREVLQTKDVTVLGPGDVHLALPGGGGGYGDPLSRTVGHVANDLSAGLVTPATATGTYGVVIDADGGVGAEATEQRRDEIRRERLASSRPASDVFGFDAPPPSEGRPDEPATHRIAEAMVIRGEGGGATIHCAKCDEPLGPGDQDPRHYAVVEELSITALSPLNVYGNVDAFTSYAFYCPGCGLRIGCEVQLREEPMRADDRLW